MLQSMGSQRVRHNWVTELNQYELAFNHTHLPLTHTHTHTNWELVMGQGGQACCSPWGLKESDTTEQLNWTNLNWQSHPFIPHTNTHTHTPIILSISLSNKCLFWGRVDLGSASSKILNQLYFWNANYCLHSSRFPMHGNKWKGLRKPVKIYI